MSCENSSERQPATYRPKPPAVGFEEATMFPMWPDDLSYLIRAARQTTLIMTECLQKAMPVRFPDYSSDFLGIDEKVKFKPKPPQGLSSRQGPVSTR
jgi:hypothetical protein